MIHEILMIVFVTGSTLGSQLLVKYEVTQIAAREPALAGWHWLLAAMLSPGVSAAVVMQGIGFAVWVVVVSRVKLGVAFAISGSFFYVLLALLSWWLYGEKLAAGQWMGIVLISVGVLMVSLMKQG
jgi:multidrug transporter EmrE-like cation transporter